MTAPRIYGTVATEAPVAAVIRRGPSDWCHVGRWDLASGAYEPGAWFRGVIYPQKCDLSPDGRWWVDAASKFGSDWPAGDIYEAISLYEKRAARAILFVVTFSVPSER